MENDPKQAAAALQAIAKAADTTAEAVKKVGQLIDQAFGNIISNSIGLVGDKLAYHRLERAIALKEKVDENLKSRE